MNFKYSPLREFLLLEMSSSLDSLSASSGKTRVDPCTTSPSISCRPPCHNNSWVRHYLTCGQPWGSSLGHRAASGSLEGDMQEERGISSSTAQSSGSDERQRKLLADYVQQCSFEHKEELQLIAKSLFICNKSFLCRLFLLQLIVNQRGGLHCVDNKCIITANDKPERVKQAETICESEQTMGRVFNRTLACFPLWRKSFCYSSVSFLIVCKASKSVNRLVNNPLSDEWRGVHLH